MAGADSRERRPGFLWINARFDAEDLADAGEVGVIVQGRAAIGLRDSCSPLQLMPLPNLQIQGRGKTAVPTRHFPSDWFGILCYLNLERRQRYESGAALNRLFPRRATVEQAVGGVTTPPLTVP